MYTSESFQRPLSGSSDSTLSVGAQQWPIIRVLLLLSGTSLPESVDDVDSVQLDASSAAVQERAQRQHICSYEDFLRHDGAPVLEVLMVDAREKIARWRIFKFLNVFVAKYKPGSIDHLHCCLASFGFSTSAADLPALQA